MGRPDRPLFWLTVQGADLLGRRRPCWRYWPKSVGGKNHRGPPAYQVECHEPGRSQVCMHYRNHELRDDESMDVPMSAMTYSLHSPAIDGILNHF